MTFAMASAT